MPLQLLAPPLLVAVRGPDGRLRQALLLGRREDRWFVQVSGGPGDNRLRWVSRDAVLEPSLRVPVVTPTGDGDRTGRPGDPA